MFHEHLEIQRGSLGITMVKGESQVGNDPSLYSQTLFVKQTSTKSIIFFLIILIKV